MDIKKYSKEVLVKLESLSDEEFNRLLIESGIENCPIDYKEYRNQICSECYRLDCQSFNREILECIKRRDKNATNT